VPGLWVQLARALPPPVPLLLTEPQLAGRPPQVWADPLAWSEAERDRMGLFGGLATDQGRLRPLRLPPEMLDGHLAVLGATGSGKSAFLAHLLAWEMRRRNTVIFAFDLHNDLARRLAGLVDPADLASGRLVVIDPVDRRPVGFPSLWDQALGQSSYHHQSEVISNIVNAMRRLSDGAWGVRVSENLQLGLETLLLASTTDWLTGRPVVPHTLLDVHALFTREGFRKTVLARLDHTQGRHLNVLATWTYLHDVHSASVELEQVQSVLNRIHPLLISAAATVLGQRHPTWSLRQALTKRQICLFSLGGLGQEGRRTLGSLLLSYLQGILLEQNALQQEEQELHKPQAALPLQGRPRVLVVVDELQAYDPNALSDMFGELRKFGGRVVVATNSLERIRHESPQLHAELLNNVGTLLVLRQGDYHDARSLLLRLQGDGPGPLTVADLQALGQRQCYVSTQVDGEVYPPFSLLTPPYSPVSASQIDQALSASRARYGRNFREVEAEVFEVDRRFKEHWQQDAARLAERSTKWGGTAQAATPRASQKPVEEPDFYQGPGGQFQAPRGGTGAMPVAAQIARMAAYRPPPHPSEAAPPGAAAGGTAPAGQTARASSPTVAAPGARASGHARGSRGGAGRGGHGQGASEPDETESEEATYS
jgi:hypothetical protein